MGVDAEKGCFADLVLINGEIITLDNENTIHEGVAVKNGKIIEVGSNSEVKYWIGNKTRVIDLNGKAVVPGFIDSHTHFIGMGLKFTYIDFSDTKSIKDALELIKKEAEKKGDDEWIIGSNWDESKWIENRYPTRWDLDKATPNKPVYIVRICGHMAVTNTLGLKLLNVPKDTRGFEIDEKTGEPTGILKEDALEYAGRVLKPSVNECLKGVKLAVDHSLKCGVTSVQDTVMSNHFSAYQIAMLENQLKVRIYTFSWYTNLEYLTALGLRGGFGNNWLKIGGIKLMVDGSIGARTAALMEPYNDDPSNRGMILIEEDDLAEIIKKANENGLQVAAHAIGDRAIETLLNAFEKAVMIPSPIGKIEPSSHWTDEVLDWKKRESSKRTRKLKKNTGWQWIKPGKAEGPILGGCLPSIVHLRGTKYWPDFTNSIFFWEIPESECNFKKGESIEEVDAYLTDLELSGVFNKIKGMLIGRPFRYTKKQTHQLIHLIEKKMKYYDFPILFNVDIGHTDPMITIPLGVKIKIDSNKNIFEFIEKGVV